MREILENEGLLSQAGYEWTLLQLPNGTEVLICIRDTNDKTTNS